MADKRNHERSAVGRVRARIRADLGWMEGFAFGGTWHAIGLGAAFELTGRHLQSALACLRWLQRDHARELRLIVDDAEDWLHRRLLLVEALKPVVGNLALMRAPLLASHLWPSALARRLRSALEGQIGEVIAAVAWTLWTTPAKLSRALAWCETHSGQLLQWFAIDDRASLPSIVRFVTFAAEEREERTAGLLAWLGDPRTARRPLKRAATENTLRKELNELVDALATLDPKTRRRAASAFALIAPLTLLDDWSAWWPKYERAKARLEGLRKVAKHSEVDAKMQRAHKRIAAIGQSAPPPVTPVTLKNLTLQLATQENADFFLALGDAFTDWPAVWRNGDPRFAFASYWSALLVEDPLKRSLALRLMRGVGEEARRRGEAGLVPWEVIFDGQLRRRAIMFDYTLLDLKPAALDVFFSVLAAQTKPLDDIDAYRLATVAECVPRERLEPVLEALRAATAWDKHMQANAVRVADALTADAPATLWAVLAALLDLDVEDLERVEKYVLPLVGPERLRELITNGHFGALLAIAYRVKFVRGFGIALPPPPEGTSDRAWSAGYPAELHGALTMLAERDTAAERTAERVVGRRMPSKDAIANELERLRAMPNLNDAQRQRRDKLAGWKVETLSSGRAANLASKLREAAYRRFLEELRSRLDDRVVAGLTRLIGSAPDRAWLANDATAEPLLALADLPKSFRALAGEVLRKRSGEPPFDLREHPNNARFLKRMAGKGIRFAPWLTPTAPVRMVAANGVPVRVGLATDPLDVLQMGRHFNTCLSPGAFNFFSTIVNAADINKRVIYIRTLEGKVLGRCLVALADNGALVAFSVYAHDRELKLDALVRAFVNDLARSMSTEVATHGNVAALTATTWYDDGTVDLVDRHPELRDGSVLRAALLELPSAEAAERIAAGIGPLTDINLPLVLGLPELRRRPEVAARLVPILNDDRLSEPTLVMLCRLLLAARDPEAARPLANAIADTLRKELRGSRYIEPALLQVLAHANPHVALSVLRAMVPNRKRDTRDPVWLYATGVALRRLGRHHQAITALEAAIQAADDDAPVLPLCREELAQLTTL